MPSCLIGQAGLLAAGEWPAALYNSLMFIKVLIGFSIIIFFHELGHFLAAKWVGVRVDRFAVGFGTRLFGWRKGEGFTFGNRPDYRAEELNARGYGETDYCFKALPLGGYVKMLGHDDIMIDEKTGAVTLSDDPRAFTSRPVGQRMIIVSAGVVFNLLLAAILLMIVFLAGRNRVAPIVGYVEPDSPAFGKLLPGDRIVEIDGQHVHSFEDVAVATIFGDEKLLVSIERGDPPQRMTETVLSTYSRSAKLRTLDVVPAMTTECVRGISDADDPSKLKVGDRVTHIDGRPVKDGWDIIRAFLQSRGKVLKLTVLRPDPADPKAPPVSTTVEERAILRFLASAGDGRQPGQDAHLLGFVRRHLVNMTTPDSAARQAGFLSGDVIAEWGGIANPTYDEIITSITSNANQAVPVVVERDGKRLNLTVTPRRPFSLFGSSDRPVVGIQFGPSSEEERPVVADIAPGTPAAELGMPRGALLLEIDGRPVTDWFEVADALLASAGRTVDVRYRTGGDEAVGRMQVPSSVVNELDIPPGAQVLAIDGVARVSISSRDGNAREVDLNGNPDAVKKVLDSKVGASVRVRYALPLSEEAPVEKTFTVRADNTDPWQLRLVYVYDPSRFKPLEEKVTAHGNPLAALGMGFNEVKKQVYQVYLFLSGLATRNISTEHVAGPVGIVSMGIQQAKLGWSDLIFFLAFLSVNLAVINFLPMPVMDGGLMVFLLIEKIKGKPLSFKVQMITTLVGLAAIILIGLFVTFNDISRLF